MKNVVSLWISAKLKRNWVLLKTIKNWIGPDIVSRFTDPIHAALSIPNVKLSDQAVFLSSEIEISSSSNAFSTSWSHTNWVKGHES